MNIIKPVGFFPLFPLDKLKIRISFHNHGTVRVLLATQGSFMNGLRVYVTPNVVKLVTAIENSSRLTVC